MATIARAGSPLTCLAVGQSGTRLYLIASNSSVSELARTATGWRPASLSLSALNNPMTCYGSDDSDILLYCVGTRAKIVQLFKYDSNWHPFTLQWHVAADSPVISIFANGFRLYYVGADRQVHRLLTLAGTFSEAPVPPAEAAPGSGLTCTIDSRGLVRVFYVDATDHTLHVLAETDPADPDAMTNDAIKGTSPAPGSALTCFTREGTGSIRVYYLDHHGRISEMAWSGDEQIVSPLVTAMPGSALASFAAGGLHTRLYYLDNQARINELAGTDDDWVNHRLAATAARGSALTCYGVDGWWTRLYYLDPRHRVNELAWHPTTGNFVNTPL
ncbi:MAG: hypothetical protein JO016_14815 [Actinobacteria bacterium]|nr:hypothetical protein [Actinomycetota bacterium]